MSTFGITVAKYGEVIDFEEYGRVRASLKPSTKATFGLASRAYYIEGQCFKTSPEMFAVGDYFTRSSDGKKYFVSTIQSEPLAPDLVYMYGIQCNAVIDIYRYTEHIDDNADKKREWELISEDVYCYRDFVDRSEKTTNDGSIPQEIFTLIVPHKYRISVGDRVAMMFNSSGKYERTNFRVESVGTSLVALSGASGVNTVQMSIDMRK